MKLLAFALIVFLFGSSSTIAQVAGLQVKVEALYAAGSYDSALVYARKVVALQPDDPHGWYGMAYLYSLAGQIDSSLIWLDGAVTRGFIDYLHFELDSDIDAIRSDPRYKRILEKARGKALHAAKEKALVVREGEWTPVVLGHPGELPRVEARISFDQNALLLRATVHDAHFKDGERAWRYGDGFMVNVVLPKDDSSESTDRFHAFGFSRERGKPVSVLVNKDGAYSLQRIADMLPTISIDTVSMTAEYDMRISWKQLYPLHPLLHTRAGLNIRYTSQGDDGRRTFLDYVETSHFDTERTRLRRFAPVTFAYRDRSPLSISGRVESRLTSGDSGNVSIAVWSPERRGYSIRLSVHDQSGSEVWAGLSGGILQPGRSISQSSFRLPPGAGRYRLAATLEDSLRWEEPLYRYDVRALERIRTMTASSLKQENSLERSSSLEGLRFRIETLNEHIQTFSDRSDLDYLRRDMEDVVSLADIFESSGSIYGRPGQLLSAFRSPFDSTLQPFSIILPGGYERSKRYRLFVGLHGSGVDEIGYAAATARNLKDHNAVVLAPRGRDLSGWWRGKDEVDAAYLIGVVKSLLSVESTLCVGFSMGGYGAWRMSMLHPELFDAAVIISGTPVPPGRAEEDDDMRNHVGRGKELSYLVIHGTDDRALPVGDTDQFVGLLKEAGYDVRYIRVQGAGHGNMEFGEEFGRWMGEKFPKSK